ncbi:MAG: SDR family NAD(P)-dependent oxidoreductase [Gammaproteobacteria bacterium]|nr:SDR family NAD(P)-dependent oxidoreductase [Gammaproteobacteria bacterium]MDH4253304.1 SDR family NAD(P)-dependent oxidoreductase [Gammaproteobacteria bacterium]MDH5310538.1 SDR family NAD(P)-dependent oxidoreductase [Gammaproteobacteria bacterium]
MKDVSGKVAFVTGGGSGVGLGQARVFARAGAKIVIADIRQDHLDDAVAQLAGEGLTAHAIRLDITDRAAYAAAADEVERVYGVVQLLFNTAGVSIFGPLEKSTYDDYDWQMGVNFGGCVNGIQTFVPRMIKFGKGGHIINTASLGAFLAAGPAGIYSASKFAVRGLSEALRAELAKYDIGVTVLCPANVNTNIAESVMTRPKQYSNSGYKFNDAILDSLRRIYSAGKDPVELAEEVLKAIRENRMYCIPYPEARKPLEKHFADVLASLPPEDADPDGVRKRQLAMEQYRKELAELQYKPH